MSRSPTGIGTGKTAAGGAKSGPRGAGVSRAPKLAGIGERSSERGKPWGFLLVLTAIVVIAIVYAVTMLTIGPEIRNPTTAIGTMAVALTVRSTLVGIYFGIKAGLDGQDKAKEMVDKAIRGGERLRRGRGE